MTEAEIRELQAAMDALPPVPDRPFLLTPDGRYRPLRFVRLRYWAWQVRYRMGWL